MSRALFALPLALACTTYVEVPTERADAAREQTGDLVITEVMIDPDACDDAQAEWFEVTNVSDDDIDLSRLTLINGAGDRARLTAEHPLRAGETTFIGRGDWESYCVGQRHPDVYFEGHLSLANDGEQLTLVDSDERVIDATPWFAAEHIVAGQSLSLRPDGAEAEANDAQQAWYLGDRCLNTAGNSPGVPNAECLVELDWLGLDCDAEGCDIPDGWDATEHLRTAHAWASGVADERVDVERDGLFFHNLRWEVEGGVDPEDWREGDAHWEITFVTYGDDLWGHNNLFVTLDVNAGTVEMYEDFASSSLAKVRIEETDGIAVTAGSVVDAVDRSWSWWGDVGMGALNRASYEDTLRWRVVDPEGDDRVVYDATTGERL